MKNKLSGYSVPKEEVKKYITLLFVWLLIMALAITGFILLYRYDNVLQLPVDEEKINYEEGVVEITDASCLNAITPLLEWQFYPNCTSYEDYLNSQEGKVIDISVDTDGVLTKDKRSSGAFVLKFKNKTELSNIPFTILIPAINSASWIFVNGEYFQGVGDVGDQYNEYSVNQNLKVNLKDELEVVIIAENRSNTIGGMLRPPLMSKSSIIMGLVNNQAVTTLVFMIYAIIVAVIGIWVYSISKDISYLRFSLLCLAFCIIVSENMFRAVGTTLIAAKEIIFSLSYIMMSLYLVLFCSSLISKTRLARLAQWIAIGFNVFAILLVLFVLPFTNKADKFIFWYINVISFLNVVYLWIHAFARYFKSSKKFIMMSTVSVLLAALVVQGILYRKYVSLYTFPPKLWGYVFIVISFSINVFNKLYEISKRESQFNENITAEVEKRTEKIESLLQERKEFTSMVAHDLKAPLASVKMMLSEVDAPRLSIDKMDKLINAIDLKIMSMTDNLTTLQNFNAIDMKNEEYQKVEVGQFLEDIYEFIIPDADAEGIHLNLKKIKKEIYVKVPVKKLTKAFENIIYNAISFCEEDDRIEIKYRIKDNEVEISVLDSGCGISPQSLPHIFDKFYSDRKSTAQGTFKGDGLGLYFVKILTQELGGNVTANSWVDIGTEIIITLPIVEVKEITK